MNINRILRTVLMVTLGMALAVGMWAGIPAQRAAAAAVENDVIINEFTINPTAGKEYVELLVVAPGGVDMRGWTLSDVGTRGGTTGTSEGDVTFPNSDYLSNVPQGTYVVIVFTTPSANSNTLTEDLSLIDGNNKLVLIIGTTTGLSPAGTIDNATNDNLQLYVGDRASGTLIDQVLCGTNVSYIAGATWGDNDPVTTSDNVNAGTALPSNSAVRFVPTSNTLAGFRDNDTGARFVVEGTSYGTPGTINNGVGADSAVTNPIYSAGAVPAGSYTGLTVDGNVVLAGNVNVYKNGLTIAGTGVFDFGTNNLSVADSNGIVTNNGMLKQTQTVNNATVNFLTISTDKYRGVDIQTPNNLGVVTVTVQGNADACTNDLASPAYIKRCFSIEPTNSAAATLTLWATDGELNGIANANLALYRFVAGWVKQSTNFSVGTGSNSYNYVTADVDGFSSFLIGDTNNAPTVVALSGLSATSPFAALAVGLLAAAGLVVLRKRK